MIKAECDRCGKQRQTDRAVVKVAAGLLSRVEVPLPEEWRRIDLPVAKPGDVPDRKELCPECVNALRQFFEGDGAVAGLLEPENLPDECTCSQPEEPRPPCRVHERCGNCGHAFHGHAEYLTDLATVTDCPECPCAAELREMDGESRPDGCIAHGGPDCVCEDPRPNLTERAKKIASGGVVTAAQAKWSRCTCAGIGYGTGDCREHNPFGLERGTHLECYQKPNGADCPGIYQRGMFAEHMSRWHGIAVVASSVPCPFCPEIVAERGRMEAHITLTHPEKWNEWIERGKPAG